MADATIRAALEVAKYGLAEVVATGKYPNLGVAGIAWRTLRKIEELEREGQTKEGGR